MRNHVFKKVTKTIYTSKMKKFIPDLYEYFINFQFEIQIQIVSFCT